MGRSTGKGRGAGGKGTKRVESVDRGGVGGFERIKTQLNGRLQGRLDPRCAEPFASEVEAGLRVGQGGKGFLAQIGKHTPLGRSEIATEQFERQGQPPHGSHQRLRRGLVGGTGRGGQGVQKAIARIYVEHRHRQRIVVARKLGGDELLTAGQQMGHVGAGAAQLLCGRSIPEVIEHDEQLALTDHVVEPLATGVRVDEVTQFNAQRIAPLRLDCGDIALWPQVR